MKHSILALLLYLFGTALYAQKPQDCAPEKYFPFRFAPPVLLGPNDPPSPPPGSAPPPTNDKRGIYWVHGLGGEVNSMARIKSATDLGDAATNFPARKTAGVTLTYEQTGINDAGLSLIDAMIEKDHVLEERGVSDFSMNFIIAHSQGGITARKADQIIDQSFPTARRHHGIVTIGTSHLGAQIINSRNQGLINEFAADACDAVLSSGAANLLGQHPMLDVFVDLNDITNGIHDLCEGAATYVLPFAVGKLFSGMSDDYAVGAPALATLQQHNNPATHKTSFYGVEYARPQDDPTDNSANPKQLIWRMLGTLPDAVSNAPVFSANNDQAWVTIANNKLAEYQAKYEAYTLLLSTIDLCTGPLEWISNPDCINNEIDYNNISDSRGVYLNAFNWAQSVDRQWKIIIGAYTFNQESFPGPCLCETADGEYMVSPPTLCVTNSEHCHTAPTAVPVFHESDGVVLASSQKGFPGTAGNFRMNNANHFQERNSEPTRQALLQLFSTGNGDSWFITPVD